MYESSFFDRVHIQQICEFFRTGGEKVPGTQEEGSLNDRLRRAEQSWRQAMVNYRKNILAADWENKTLTEQNFLDEELQQDILGAEERQKAISFEAGFLAGLRLGWELSAGRALPWKNQNSR